MSKSRTIFHSGTSLVEAIVGVAIVGFALVGSITTFNLYVKSWSKNLANVQSSYLLNEGMEVLYLLRDNGWIANIKSLVPGTDYYLVWDNGTATWSTSIVHTFVDGKFDRYFTVATVFRDGASNIVTSGGSEDYGTKLVTIHVGWWNGTATTTKSTSAYLFDLYHN